MLVFNDGPLRRASFFVRMTLALRKTATNSAKKEWYRICPDGEMTVDSHLSAEVHI
jgi:hypothetical protein